MMAEGRVALRQRRARRRRSPCSRPRSTWPSAPTPGVRARDQRPAGDGVQAQRTVRGGARPAREARLAVPHRCSRTPPISGCARCRWRTRRRPPASRPRSCGCAPTSSRRWSTTDGATDRAVGQPARRVRASRRARRVPRHRHRRAHQPRRRPGGRDRPRPRREPRLGRAAASRGAPPRHRQGGRARRRAAEDRPAHGRGVRDHEDPHHRGQPDPRRELVAAVPDGVRDRASRTTSGGTAAATRTGIAPSRSRWPAASSPSPTCSTRCAAGAPTSGRGRWVEAARFIVSGRGAQFEPDLVDAFVSVLLARYPELEGELG